MNALPVQDRDELVALLDRALLDEERAERPSDAELGDWLYGSAGFTEPDEHDWMAPVPPADVWAPRALVLWRMAMLSDAPVGDGQMRDPVIRWRAGRRLRRQCAA